MVSQRAQQANTNRGANHASSILIVSYILYTHYSPPPTLPPLALKISASPSLNLLLASSNLLSSAAFFSSTARFRSSRAVLVSYSVVAGAVWAVLMGFAVFCGWQVRYIIGFVGGAWELGGRWIVGIRVGVLRLELKEVEVMARANVPCLPQCVVLNTVESNRCGAGCHRVPQGYRASHLLELYSLLG